MRAFVQRRSTTRLLTRHFLRRFVENDLVSPHIDLHENAAVACAAVVSTLLFLSVMLGGKYLMGNSPNGIVAIETLGDNFGFVNISIFAMALVAALQWDALSFDIRDTANLGILPLERGALVRAKLSALVIFAAGFAVALNLFPSIVFQMFTTVRMPVGFSGLLRLVGAHAAASLLASFFGFLVVVAARELVRAILGDAWFSRASAMLQGTLVLVSITALLLTPALANRAKNTWLRNGFPSGWQAAPIWFMGLEQTLGGGAIAHAAGFDVPRRMAESNTRALDRYYAREPFFGDAARTALFATGVVAAVAAGAYGWNLRRAPQPPVAVRRRRSFAAAMAKIGGGRDSVRRAGFVFALHALVRSAPHRLAMAAAAGLAIAMSLAILSRTGFRPALDPSYAPLSILAVQTVVLTILLAGLRRAVRVPAELQANWILQMTWNRAERRFLAGVRRAAVVGVAVPLLLLLAPLHVWLLSGKVAAQHLLIGFCYSVALTEALFAGCRKVPLASSYEPLTNVKTIGPIVFILFLMFVNAFAQLERSALESDGRVINFALALISCALAARALDHWLVRDARQMKFDEPPEPATQWLGLSG
jgi:hypothetical protein